MELILPGIPKDQITIIQRYSQDLTHFGFVSKDSGKIIDKILIKMLVPVN